MRARYVVVADGANSRFRRALGCAATVPLGMAVRGYFTSPFHDEPWIESHLDLRDRDGNHLPGYGWIFPVGDGTVNVGVGLLSTFTGWKDINTSTLMDAFVETAPARWGISPDTSCGPPTGGKLPTGGSVAPNVGPTWLVVGDAAGSVNPFNGEGISLAYETGRLAADAVSTALTTGDGLALARYPQQLEEIYGLYWKVARAFVRLSSRNLGRDAREHTQVGVRWLPLMEWVLRIAWPASCVPTRNGPPKPPTRWSPPWSPSPPSPDRLVESDSPAADGGEDGDLVAVVELGEVAVEGSSPFFRGRAVSSAGEGRDRTARRSSEAAPLGSSERGCVRSS